MVIKMVQKKKRAITYYYNIFSTIATEPLTYWDSVIVVVVWLRRGYNNRLNHLGT